MTEMPRTPLSVLDLVPVGDGSNASAALASSVDLARLVERLGYTRLWVAEHHNMPGIASSSPPVLIAHLAAATETIRVGAGGVMLPNHAVAGRRRAVRDARGAAPRPHRPRHRTGAGHRSGHRRRAAAQPVVARGRRVPRAAPRPLRVLRRHPPADHRRARARLPPRGVDARLERLQRAGRGRARAAVLVRAPLRVAEHGRRARDLPRVVPAVGRPRGAVLDDRRPGHLRRHRRAGALAVRLERAVVRPPPPGPARAAADARGGGRVRVHADRTRDRPGVDRAARPGRSRPRARPSSKRSSNAPAPTS